VTRKKWATLKWMILRCSRPGFSELGTPAVLGKPRTVKSATRGYKFPFWKELLHGGRGYRGFSACFVSGAIRVSTLHCDLLVLVDRLSIARRRDCEVGQ
jgi:hypothetical protein